MSEVYGTLLVMKSIDGILSRGDLGSRKSSRHIHRHYLIRHSTSDCGQECLIHLVRTVLALFAPFGVCAHEYFGCSVTLPHFPYPPETILYPGHAIVEEYQHSIVDHYRLSSYIHLNSEVVEARWVGSETQGTWLLTVQDTRQGSVEETSFDHLIVASGHNHFPYEPKLGGEDEWPGRIMHSTYYRRAEEFSGRNIVVVGGGASGQDIALRVAPFANSVRYIISPLSFYSF